MLPEIPLSMFASYIPRCIGQLQANLTQTHKTKVEPHIQNIAQILEMDLYGSHPGIIRWYPSGSEEVQCHRRCRRGSEVGVCWYDDSEDCDSDAHCRICNSSCSPSARSDDGVDCDASHAHRRHRLDDRPVIVQCEDGATAPARRPSCLLGLFLPRRAPNSDYRIRHVQERGRARERNLCCRGATHREHGRHRRRVPSLWLQWRTYIFGNPQIYQHPCERRHTCEGSRSRRRRTRHC